MKTVPYLLAQKIAWSAILIALCIPLYSNLTCYEKTVIETLVALAFQAIPLIPAFIAIFSPNPLKAIGPSIIAAIFYLFAHNVDCVQSYEGGGASMIYVVVIMYGLPLAFIASWITGVICNSTGIVVKSRQQPSKSTDNQ